MFRAISLVVAIAAPLATAFDCPAEGDAFLISSSGSLNPLTTGWATHYPCPNIAVQVRNTNDPIDICNDTGIDVAATTATEGTTCLSRPTVQIQVARQAMVPVVASTGSALDCVTSMGGLSMDQLRWIFTNYTKAELIAAGNWNAASAVPNDDGEEAYKTFREMFLSCSSVRVAFGGPARDTEAYEAFRRSILPDWSKGEGFGDAYIETTGTIYSNMVTYRGFTSSASTSGRTVPVYNQDQVSFEASETNIVSGSYPLTRPIYYNFGLNKEATRSFLQFGFSTAGETQTKQAGYWPISTAEQGFQYQLLVDGSQLTATPVTTPPSAPSVNLATLAPVVPAPVSHPALQTTPDDVIVGGACSVSLFGGNKGCRDRSGRRWLL